MSVTVPSHIEINDQGRAVVAGTRFKVSMLIVDTRQGMTPEKIVEQFQPLTLAQVYSALSYYHDHRDEIDAEITQSQRYAETMRQQAGPSPLTQKLRAAGKLP
jgi:uncharacterized protein (DUF433 family)